MSPRASKEHSASPRTKGSSKRTAQVARPSELKAEAVVRGLEGLVHSIGELRVEAMLRAVEQSIESQKERTNMPERTLTAAAALKQAKGLHNIKPRLDQQEDNAAKEILDIREKVQLTELQTFDDDFDDWLNG
jgi:hypothetical protein